MRVYVYEHCISYAHTITIFLLIKGKLAMKKINSFSQISGGARTSEIMAVQVAEIAGYALISRALVPAIAPTFTKPCYFFLAGLLAFRKSAEYSAYLNARDQSDQPVSS